MDACTDPRVSEILARCCSTLPPSVSGPARRVIRLLLASHTWGDVRVFTRVMALPDGRFIAPVSGKWGVSFDWLDGTGPRALALQRV